MPLQLTSADTGRRLSRHKGLVIFPAGTSLESLWPFPIEQTIGRAAFWIQISTRLTFFTTERTFCPVFEKVLPTWTLFQDFMDQLCCASGKFGFCRKKIHLRLADSVSVLRGETQADLAQITSQCTFWCVRSFRIQVFYSCIWRRVREAEKPPQPHCFLIWQLRAE